VGRVVSFDVAINYVNIGNKIFIALLVGIAIHKLSDTIDLLTIKLVLQWSSGT
jgi:hypothetical protein